MTRLQSYRTICTSFLVALLSCLTTVVRAEIIDLTSHTTLKGAYVLEQPSATEVNVTLLIEAGEFDNTGPQGLPHYLEHLVFWSADKEHGKGQKDRVANAWVSRNWTSYWNTGPVGKTIDMIAVAAKVFADIDLEPRFASSERNIVEREYDFRLAESAPNQLFEKMHNSMYKEHAFSRSVLGDKDTIRQFSIDLANQFKDKWYLANNATLLIAGPVKASKIKPLLKTHLNDLPTGDVPTHSWKSPALEPEAVNVRMQHQNLTVPKLLYFKYAARVSSLSLIEQFAATNLLCEVLNSSQPGSISKPLYYDDFLVLSVGANCYIQPDDTVMLVVEAEPFEGVDEEQLFAAIDNTTSQLLAYDVFQASFKKIKEKRLKVLKRHATHNSKQLGWAVQSVTHFGYPLSYEQYIEQVESLSAKSAYTVLEALVNSEIVARGSVHPEK